MQRSHSNALSILTSFVLGLALAASATQTATAQSSGTKVGVAAAVRGEVSAQSPGSAKRALHSGDAVYLGDTVATGSAGNLQILLLDETVFTVGLNSSVVIDEFVYDPASHDGKVDVRMNQGTFRFTTGQIARKSPEQLKVKLPVVTIGVRGTGAIGQTDGQSASVMLSERGGENDLGLPSSSIILSNGQGSTEVADSGFGSDIPDPNSPPSPPALWDDNKINGILNALQGGDGSTGGSNLGGGEDGQSGQIGALPDGQPSPLPTPFELEEIIDWQRENASQDALDSHLDDWGWRDGCPPNNPYCD